MKLIKNWLLLAFSGIAFFILSFSAQREWEILGEQKLNLALEFNEFELDSNNRSFGSLKLKVLDQSVFFHHITIHYSNGGSEVKMLKKRVKAGQETKAFDLEGENRIIKKIKFLYKTNKKANSRATIIVLGK